MTTQLSVRKLAWARRLGVRSLAARVLTVALLATLAALLALPVQAQTTLTTFISNTSAPVEISANAFYQAMSFETGTAGSYTLSEVDVYLLDATGLSTSVNIRENNSSDEPGDLVGTTLTNPASLTSNSLNTFTHSGITLAAGTTYWVSVNEGIDDVNDRATVGRAEISNSNSNTTGETGWSFVSARLYRSTAMGSWAPDSATTLLMAVRGTTTLSTDATLSSLRLLNITLSPPVHVRHDHLHGPSGERQDEHVGPGGHHSRQRYEGDQAGRRDGHGRLSGPGGGRQHDHGGSHS